VEIYGKMRNLGTRLKRKNKITDYSNIAASRCLKGYDGMTKILFVCHGSILRSLEKACYINGFHRSDGAYYTTITPFVEEL
jgi:hypothetical protein